MTFNTTVDIARALLGGVVGSSVLAQHDVDSSPPPIELAALLEAMAEKNDVRTRSLREYSAVRRYALENRKFRVTAEMTVRMSYRQPGTKAFDVVSERGSALIRKRVLREIMAAELIASQDPIRRATQITADNYSFQYVKTAVENGRSCHVLAVEPRVQSKFLIRGNIWVDAEDLAII